MRRYYENILKITFHTHLIRCRYALNLTQEEMAAKLMMAGRSYIDLDHGKSCCSALTLALFLLYVCPDTLAFLAALRAALEEGQEAA